MSVITDTWRQLVRRRLWPVAVLLVAALAAVPFLLAKDPEPAPVVAPASGGADPAADKGVLASEPIVALATSEDRAKRRRVLGVRHDIFKPTKKAAKAKTAKAAGAGAAAKKTPEAATSASAGSTSAGSAGSGTSTSTSTVTGATAGSGGTDRASTGTTDAGTPTPAPTPTPTATPAPAAPTWPANSLTVRFGDATADSLEKSTLERLNPLPSADDPVAIFLGLADGGTSAVFMLGDGVQPTGDGTCTPEPTSCETLVLKAGDTEFLDVMGADATTPAAQYELDVVALHPRKPAAAGS